MATDRETSYDVRIWKTEKYAGKKVTTYTVRWSVAGRAWKEPHRTTAMAESFRSRLVAAMREGQAFDVATGRPVSMVRAETPVTTWYDFACRYVDMKWPAISGKYRKGVAEALLTVTPVMLTAEVDDATSKAIRSALLNWGFNARRGSEAQPGAATAQLDWVARNCRPVGDLSRPEVLRSVLDALASRLDGKPAAGRTTHRKRAVLSNALSYAVELGLLPSNPIGSIKWTAPKTASGIDRRSVANPDQARALLEAVRGAPRSGKRLVAFGCLYYSALRPEEAVTLRRRNLDLPESGWGWITLDRSAPDAGKAWTDSGVQREERQLKHRAVEETRRVPCPQPLVVLLKAHLEQYGTDSSGRLFRGERGGELATVTYSRAWQRARKAVLGEEEAAESMLARRPYDLRHAAVSTWLAGGVPPAQVAAWAGHSLDVLLRIYAKVLDGQEEVALGRIAQALGEPDAGHGPSDDPPPTDAAAADDVPATAQDQDGPARTPDIEQEKPR